MALQHDDVIDDLLPPLVALRRDLHAHPELAFEERRTAGVVAAALRLLGLDVTEGIAGTGVIGTLRHGSGRRAVGLRADWTRCRSPSSRESRIPAVMPACTTAAAMTATRRCCSAQRSSLRARGDSMGRCTSSSSPPKRAAAARA
jgi:metal-dependent amidase/aminoacylase/carboxypeptidase family protein